MPMLQIVLRDGRLRDAVGYRKMSGSSGEGSVVDMPLDVSAAKVPAGEIKTDGIINLTPEAIAQITTLRKSRGQDEVVLRVGVRAGGCRCVPCGQRPGSYGQICKIPG